MKLYYRLISVIFCYAVFVAPTFAVVIVDKELDPTYVPSSSSQSDYFYSWKIDSSLHQYEITGFAGLVDLGSFVRTSLTWNVASIPLSSTLWNDPISSVFAFDPTSITNPAIDTSLSMSDYFGSMAAWSAQAVGTTYDTILVFFSTDTPYNVPAYSIRGGNQETNNQFAWAYTTDTLGSPVAALDSQGNTFFGESGQSLGAVPVPAAIWLFGSGLLGLVGIARYKKTA